jgi:DNA-binding LacI/PurR family transcriptional regulator/DNA-binding transcriptional regulator YhcF (GntR family)
MARSPARTAARPVDRRAARRRAARSTAGSAEPPARKLELARIPRPLSLTAQVEQILREAVAAGTFSGGRLPTEVELADRLGVSRETVRRATESLARDGLLVKYRRKGTFLSGPPPALRPRAEPATQIAYLQAEYGAGTGREESVTRAISGAMLQGAIEEAAAAGCELVVRRAPALQMEEAFHQVHRAARLRGVIFASFGEEKLLRKAAGLGLPTMLLDHDLHLPQVGSVRDDSFQAARDAVAHLAGLGHRRIAFAHWYRTELNPWRLRGYRQGLADAGLPRRRAWEISVELTAAGAGAAVDAVLALSPRPTALMCFTNTFARQAIDELARRGLKAPDDISVMGGGGEDVPGLSGHQVDWHRMGRTAVQALLRMSDPGRPAAPEHHLAPAELRKGRTTAAPPRTAAAGDPADEG